MFAPSVIRASAVLAARLKASPPRTVAAASPLSPAAATPNRVRRGLLSIRRHEVIG